MSPNKFTNKWNNNNNTKILSTGFGKIKGLKKENYNVFFSIPYATSKRFNIPFFIKPWKGIVDCTKYKNDAFQEFDNGIKQNEDCLNLTIWTPKKNKKKLPVFVWIHGGGYAVNAPNQIICDGKYLATKDMIVVAIKYRLNAFGFFATFKTKCQAVNDEDKKLYWKNKQKCLATTKKNNEPIYTNGNWGINDQIKALQWIKKNIKYFKGDKNNITIAGESAGSFSVSNLICSPAALAKNQSDKNPLFHKAIMESGCLWNSENIEEKIKRCEEISKKMKNNTPQEYVNHTKMSWNMISKEQYNHNFFASLMPNYDEWIVADNWKEKIENDNFNKVPILLGWNKNEGRLFGDDESGKGMKEEHAKFSYEYFVNDKISNLKEKDCYEKLKKMINENSLDKLSFRKENNSKPCQEVISLMFSYPMIWLANTILEMKKVPIYVYNFCYEYFYPFSVPFSSAHTAEIPMVFNSLNFKTEEDKWMQKNICENWVNFIKNGKPKEKKWKKYSIEKPFSLHFCNIKDGGIFYSYFWNYEYITSFIKNFPPK